MFENCNTLAELNSARITAAASGVDLMEVNNAYNARRQEILNERTHYIKLVPIVVKAREVKKYCGIPLVGRSSEKGCISFTPKGFMY